MWCCVWCWWCVCVLFCCGGACVWCVVKLGTLSLSLSCSLSFLFSFPFAFPFFFSLIFIFSLLFLFLLLLLLPLLLLLLLFFLFFLLSPLLATNQPTRRPTSRHLNVIWRRAGAQQSVLSLLLSPPSSLLPLPSSKKRGNFLLQEYFQRRNYFVLQFKINSKKSPPGEITGVTFLY